MSWLRSALSRAAEATGAGKPGSNIGRARSFVQNAGNAVAGGAKIVLERAVNKNYNNFKHAVKRLDEVSLNARGEERSQALARWLGALKDLDRDSKQGQEKTGREDGGPSGNEESEEDSAQQQSRVAMVLFYDPEVSNEPLTFRDVFLRSSALENISSSLILEAPDDAEVSLVLEMFGLCLSGGPEVHNAVMSGIQDLGKAVKNYQELLLKQDDLLRMAADVVSGLKINAEVERLDLEALSLEHSMSDHLGRITLKDTPDSKPEPPAEGQMGVLSDVPLHLTQGASVSEEVLGLGSRVMEVVARKELLLQQGDTDQIRTMKVEKLKTLSEDLKAGAKSEGEKITACKQQKQDAMAYRVTKAQEVQDCEKVIQQEMQVLQKRRDELEAELKAVVQTIVTATKKHLHIQEEKEQFDEASSNIIGHLATQEEELSRSLTQHESESKAADTWRNFLEDTWKLQTTCQENKEKIAKEVASASRARFWQVAVGHLVYRQEEMMALLLRIKMYNEELSTIRAKKVELERKGMDGVVAEISGGRKKVEEKYVEVEIQIRSAFVSIEKAKADLRITMENIPAEGDAEERSKMEEFVASLDVFRRDYESIKRPKLDIEALHPPRPRKMHSKSSESWGGRGGMPGGPRAALSPPKPTARPILVSTPLANTLDKAAVEEGGAGDGWELEDGAEEEVKVEEGRGGSSGSAPKSGLGRSGEEERKVEASGTQSGPGRGVSSIVEDTGIE